MRMPVIGIDLGNQNTCVAVARNKGIDIVVNEVSNRLTPSMVSFNGNQRFLGEAAKTQEVSNSKHTVTSLKRLIGRNFDESEVQEVEKHFLFWNLCASENGSTAAKVNYSGDDKVFDTTQLAAMLLTQLKQVSELSLESEISSAVIAIPAYYTDRQKHAILTAAEIADLNCIRLINEPTAAALAYGITRVSDLPEKDPRNVCFIDIGHSAMSVSIASFTKEKAEIKSCAFDRHLGGRVIDDLLVKHFIEKIKEKHKVDLTGNAKATLRLRVAIEKMKHMLSSNAQSVLHIECLTDVLDINFAMKREEFEQLCARVFERVSSPIQTALKDAGLKKEAIHFVEIIGGSTRIPAIQAKITEIFERPEVLSKTLNMDEAIARGAALQCAILSPLFKVRDYQIKDVTAYGIKVTGADPKSDGVIFKPGDPTPSSKTQSHPADQSPTLEFRAEYSNSGLLPPGSQPFIGKYVVNEVKPGSKVEVTFALDESGMFSVEKAEQNQQELKVTASTSKIDDAQRDRFKALEEEMAASDKLIKETHEKKNALESYIYEMRNKLRGSFSEYISDKSKDEFLKKLDDAENWFRSEEETATKGAYVDKIAALQKLGQPVVLRHQEDAERGELVAELEKTLEQLKAQAQANKAEGASTQKNPLLDECVKKEAWLKDTLAAQGKLKKHEDPKLKVKDLKSARDGLLLLAASLPKGQ